MFVEENAELGNNTKAIKYEKLINNEKEIKSYLTFSKYSRF